jgi:hypothetical protein
MKVRLNNVRIAFAHGLFTASALEENQTPKFGADFILTPGHSVQKEVIEGDTKKWVPTKMSEVLLALADEGWKGKGKTALEGLETSKKCLRPGNTKTNKSGDVYDGFSDLWYVAAKNKARPDVRDANKAVLTEKDGKPYSGCYVNAIIDVYCMTDPKKKGVHAALKGVQFVRDGDAFGGGGVASEDDYDDLSVTESTEADALV